MDIQNIIKWLFLTFLGRCAMLAVISILSAFVLKSTTKENVYNVFIYVLYTCMALLAGHILYMMGAGIFYSIKDMLA